MAEDADHWKSVCLVLANLTPEQHYALTDHDPAFACEVLPFRQRDKLIVAGVTTRDWQGKRQTEIRCPLTPLGESIRALLLEQRVPA